ncbi:MAG: DUF898 family protein [Deltaproteobacteria bacterium]|nr:DUF898 family protein [Deltaproteobacteria bacterium]
MNESGGILGEEGVAEPARPGTVVFDGLRSELARLLIRNLLLSLLTLGIYRFWAKTRVRHLLWRHVKILGEPLEYLGTGTELLIGFLVVIVFFAPAATAYSYFVQFLIPWEIPFSGIAMQLFYYAVLAFLIQVAVYRVRRYRLTRTAWRGVRFGLHGSAFKYAAIWLLYGLMTVATLGLAYPWLRIATARYFANNVRFGSVSVFFDAGAGGLLRRWLTVVAPGLAAIGLFVAVNGEGFEALGSLWNALREGNVIANPAPLVLFVVRKFDLMPLWLVVLSLSLFVWYRVGEFRYFVGAMRIGETRLSSRMNTPVVYGVYFAFLVVVVGVALFLLIGVLGGLIGVLKLNEVTGSQVVFLMTTAVLLAIYWFYGFIRMLLVKVTLLTNICGTLSLERHEALDRTVQGDGRASEAWRGTGRCPGCGWALTGHQDEVRRQLLRRHRGPVTAGGHRDHGCGHHHLRRARGHAGALARRARDPGGAAA